MEWLLNALTAMPPENTANILPAERIASSAAPAAQPADADAHQYRRASRAMFFGGFATFAMLYGLQPLMPLLSHEFGLSPAAASGVMSFATGCMAVCLIPASLLADRIGRRPIMNASLVLASLLTLVSAWVGDFSHLLLLRAVFGIALAGLPAVAMTYLSEEMPPQILGRAIGLYIAGNAMGGMCARVASALMADHWSWRTSMVVLGVLGLVAAWEFWRSLPPSRHFTPHVVHPRQMAADAIEHFRDGGLPWLFATAFLLMGCFVSFYNYLGYRLSGAPFNLRTGVQGLIFSLYLFGIFSSAWAGGLADRLGRRRVLWIMVVVMGSGLLLSLSTSVLPMLAGVSLVTFGFFGAHSVASSWVGRRATRAKALASALYLSAYYLGSSVLGSATGVMWHAGGWVAIIATLGALLAGCLVIALRLRTLEPRPVAA